MLQLVECTRSMAHVNRHKNATMPNLYPRYIGWICTRSAINQRRQVLEAALARSVRSSTNRGHGNSLLACRPTTKSRQTAPATVPHGAHQLQHWTEIQVAAVSAPITGRDFWTIQASSR